MRVISYQSNVEATVTPSAARDSDGKYVPPLSLWV